MASLISRRIFSFFALFPLLLPQQAMADLSYPGCADLDASHFRSEDIATTQGDGLWEPVKITFGLDDMGNADVYIVELRDPAHSVGRIRRYSTGAGSLTTLGQLTVSTGGGNYDEGILGMVLDPDFRSNGWFYLHINTEEKTQILRYTLRGDQIDYNSKTILLEQRIQTDGMSHTGGGMAFDEYGDLWVTMGDNKTDDEGPANSNDLRGKILRIRPLPAAEGTTDWGAGKTYTIPPGNFGEYWEQKWTELGEPAIAADYGNPDLMRPEIFVMGTRNAYNMTLDPVRRWVTWGDCGPDFAIVTEEHNVATEPGFYGWPYFAGRNILLHHGYIEPNGNIDPDRPFNALPENTGVRNLPPAVPGTHSYQQACAMTGPIYRYNPSVDNSTKMPPHFHRWWFVTDFNHSWVDAIRLDPAGKEIVEQIRLTGGIWDNVKVFRPLDFQMGPDGALYLANYGGYGSSVNGTAITRIEYIGPPCDVGPDFVVEKAGCMNEGDPAFDPEATHHNPYVCGTAAYRPALSPSKPGVSFTNGQIAIHDFGPHTVQVLSPDGKLLKTIKGESQATYGPDIIRPSEDQSGVSIVRVETPKGTISGKSVSF